MSDLACRYLYTVMLEPAAWDDKFGGVRVYWSRTRPRSFQRIVRQFAPFGRRNAGDQAIDMQDAGEGIFDRHFSAVTKRSTEQDGCMPTPDKTFR
jgi:hypothetical protein